MNSTKTDKTHTHTHTYINDKNHFTKAVKSQSSPNTRHTPIPLKIFEI